jgi:hypothetical protein
MRALFLIGSFILFDKLHYIHSGLNSKRWEETNKSDKRKLHDKFIEKAQLFDALLGGNRDPRSSSFSFTKSQTFLRTSERKQLSKNNLLIQV